MLIPLYSDQNTKHRIYCFEGQSVDEAIKWCNAHGVSILDVYVEDETVFVKAMKPIGSE